MRLLILFVLAASALFADTQKLSSKQLKDGITDDGSKVTLARPVVIGAKTLATLPAAASCVRCLAVVTNASTATSCSGSIGVYSVVCYSDGSAWSTFNNPVAPSYTVSTLPAGVQGKIVMVTDGASTSDCVTGSGTTKVACIYDGSAWVALMGSGNNNTGGAEDYAVVELFAALTAQAPGSLGSQVQLTNTPTYGAAHPSIGVFRPVVNVMYR